jgi:hypothetical protein
MLNRQSLPKLTILIEVMQKVMNWSTAIPKHFKLSNADCYGPILARCVSLPADSFALFTTMSYNSLACNNQTAFAGSGKW